MSHPVHLAIDLGASSGRVIAGSVQEGRIVLEELHRFENNPVSVQDTMQWNVLGLWAEILTGLRKAGSRFEQIASVGVDSWGVDFVLLDEHDHMAGPARHYRDSRNDGMVERACEIVPRDRIFSLTGLQFMQINSLYQLLAMAGAKEHSMETGEAFLMIGDFFHWLLSGKRSVEATNASTSQLLNPTTGDWAWELIEAFGIPKRLFAPVTEPASTLGMVQETVAEATGLKNVPVVVPATHDTASAVIAVPAEEFAAERPNWCFISSGTWSLMGCEVAQPRVNDLCAELNFTNERGVAGSTRLLKNIGGLWVFQQIRKSLQRRGRDVSWEDMVSQAKEATPFKLLINPDAADFTAPADMIDAIDAYAARTGQDVAGDESVYFRAALEGLALRYRVSLGMLEQLVGNRIETIHIVGGGTMNELLCQMTADACGRVVVAGPVEATAIGNVVMQMVGVGAFGDVEQSDAILKARQLVRESFEVKTYTPVGADRWDEPAARFVELD
ncbi:MAG: rhamnulokinase family protein [Planctomycetota bacterium]